MGLASRLPRQVGRARGQRAGRSRSQRLLLIHHKPIMKRVTLRKLGLAIYQLKFKLVPVTTHIVAEGELRAESSEHSESNKDQVRTTIICK